MNDRRPRKKWVIVLSVIALIAIVNELPRLRLREVKSNVDLRVVIEQLCQGVAIPFYLGWGEVEFSDASMKRPYVPGEATDADYWVARGAASAASIRTRSNSVGHPIIKVLIQEFSKMPSFKPWVYSQYFRKFLRSKDGARADYSGEYCWCIGRGAHDDDYAYPACSKEMIFGNYQAQIYGYFQNERCLKSEDGFTIAEGKYQSFEEMTHAAEVSAARMLSATH